MNPIHVRTWKRWAAFLQQLNQGIDLLLLFFGEILPLGFELIREFNLPSHVLHYATKVIFRRWNTIRWMEVRPIFKRLLQLTDCTYIDREWSTPK